MDEVNLAGFLVGEYGNTDMKVTCGQIAGDIGKIAVMDDRHSFFEQRP